ncbi:MAG: LysM peptidoglycan-binding domain-containing protein [Acidobacteria bacterium]|nr:LysM peptidoglycan-binding domain-containing protein [Acidobacteriota bacterium]
MPLRMRRLCLWGAGLVLLGLAVAGLRGSSPPFPAAPPEPPAPSAPSAPTAPDGRPLLPLDEFSPQFLGMFRKALTIEDELRRHTERYGVDFDLARAVLIQESGGNPHLTSVAGAGGYFQVMPATFRGLRVDTNIEAGIKYISQMVRQFGREDYAVAAYNGGPSRARRGRPPLETLQYVLSVGAYRSLLKMHEASIRHHADLIRLEPIRRGDDWWALSQRTGASLLELRMHNPFLATRALREGQFIAYPRDRRPDLLGPAGPEHVTYRARLGDNYLHLAYLLEVDRDGMRELNDLWHLQTLPPGQVLRLPLAWEGEHTVYTVREGDDLKSVADRLRSTPWRIVRDNALFRDQTLTPGTVLRVREAAPQAVHVTHRVVRGDTLGAIATRYGTSVRAIQNANGLGRRTMIRVGQRLRIPTRDR